MKDTVDKIERLKNKISVLKREITQLQTDIDNLNDREKLIDKARNNDILAFENRQRRDAASIGALE